MGSYHGSFSASILEDSPLGSVIRHNVPLAAFRATVDKLMKTGRPGFRCAAELILWNA